MHTTTLSRVIDEVRSGYREINYDKNGYNANLRVKKHG